MTHGLVRLYHGTSAAAADEILEHGFRDGPPQWGAQLAGVWLATYPLDQNEGVTGGRPGGQVDLVHLAVDIAKRDADVYEVEHPVAQRIVMIPAAVVSRYPVALVGDEERDELRLEHDRWVDAGMHGPFVASQSIVERFPIVSSADAEDPAARLRPFDITGLPAWPGLGRDG